MRHPWGNSTWLRTDRPNISKSFPSLYLEAQLEPLLEQAEHGFWAPGGLVLWHYRDLGSIFLSVYSMGGFPQAMTLQEAHLWTPGLPHWDPKSEKWPSSAASHPFLRHSDMRPREIR